MKISEQVDKLLQVMNEAAQELLELIETPGNLDSYLEPVFTSVDPDHATFIRDVETVEASLSMIQSQELQSIQLGYKLKSVVNTLQDRRASVRKTFQAPLGRVHNSRAAISTLPNEILREIFHLLRPRFSYENYYNNLLDTKGLYAITAVCRLWRSVATEHRLLWNMVDSEWEEERIRTWLGRSGPLMSTTRISSRNDYTHLQELVNSRSQELARTSELIILYSGDAHDGAWEFYRHLFSSRALPNIQTLRISTSNPSSPYEQESALFDGSLLPTRVKYLELNGTEMTRPSFPSLTKLCLRDVYFPISSWETMFQSLSQLEDLSISECETVRHDEMSDIAGSCRRKHFTFILPSLHSLHLNLYDPTLCDLLSTLGCMPALRLLHVVNPGPLRRPDMTPLVRNVANLEHCEFDNCWKNWNYSYIVPIFKALCDCRSLKDLTILRTKPFSKVEELLPVISPISQGVPSDSNAFYLPTAKIQWLQERIRSGTL